MTPDVVVIRAGTNRPVEFEMPSDFDMTGRVFELVVSWPGNRRVYGEGSGLSKAGRVITWLHSLADSRAFPEGRIATGELQWTAGAVQDSDIFTIEALPGASND